MSQSPLPADRLLLDPAPEYARWREEPIRRVGIWGDISPWLITRHADARAVLADRRFSADTTLPGFPGLQSQAPPQAPGMLFMMDAPDLWGSDTRSWPRPAGPTGCVTELPEVRGPALPAFTNPVFCGHDLVAIPLVRRPEALAAGAVLPCRLVAALGDELAEVERELRPAPTGGTHADRAAALTRDLTGFRRRHGLARVVVVNVAATELAARPHLAQAEPSALAGAGEVLPPSLLYAYAAMTPGCPYVDLTPSTGMRLPALSALADSHRLPYAGHDGTTGETLLKSVLAPMFAMRRLTVRSWSGINLLGGDGATLADPAANVRSKQRILGYLPQSGTRIEYVENLGHFKTAWDLVTFAGFLGRDAAGVHLARPRLGAGRPPRARPGPARRRRARRRPHRSADRPHLLLRGPARCRRRLTRRTGQQAIGEPAHSTSF